MTRVEAYIRPQKLEKVQDALEELDISGMTVTDVRGMGRSKAPTHSFRGSQYSVNLNPRVKIETIVNDDQVEEVIEAIRNAASTGEVGDGKIVTIPLGEVVRIRSGERAEAALP